MQSLLNTPAKIKVEGEDDLASIAVIYHAKLGDWLVYGRPGIGVDLIQIDERLKMFAHSLLKK